VKARRNGKPVLSDLLLKYCVAFGHRGKSIVRAGPKICPIFRQVCGPGGTVQAAGLRFTEELPQHVKVLP